MIHLSRWKVILLILSFAFGVFFAYPNLLSAEIDLDLVDEVRQRIPVFEDRRPDLY